MRDGTIRVMLKKIGGKLNDGTMGSKLASEECGTNRNKEKQSDMNKPFWRQSQHLKRRDIWEGRRGQEARYSSRPISAVSSAAVIFCAKWVRVGGS